MRCWRARAPGDERRDAYRARRPGEGEGEGGGGAYPMMSVAMRPVHGDQPPVGVHSGSADTPVGTEWFLRSSSLLGRRIAVSIQGHQAFVTQSPSPLEQLTCS